MTDQELDYLLSAERKKTATTTLEEVRKIVKTQNQHSSMKKILFFGLNSFLIFYLIVSSLSSNRSSDSFVKDVAVVEFTPKSVLIINTDTLIKQTQKINSIHIKKTSEDNKQRKEEIQTSTKYKEKIATLVKDSVSNSNSIHKSASVKKPKYDYILHPTRKGNTKKTNYNYILHAGATKEDVHNLFSRFQQIGADVKLKKEKYDRHGKLKKIAFMNGKMDFEPHKFEKIMFIVMNTSYKRVEVVIINGVNSSY